MDIMCWISGTDCVPEADVDFDNVPNSSISLRKLVSLLSCLFPSTKKNGHHSVLVSAMQNLRPKEHFPLLRVLILGVIVSFQS